MLRIQIQAGNRASKSGHPLQRWERLPEYIAISPVKSKQHDSISIRLRLGFVSSGLRLRCVVVCVVYVAVVGCGVVWCGVCGKVVFLLVHWACSVITYAGVLHRNHVGSMYTLCCCRHAGLLMSLDWIQLCMGWYVSTRGRARTGFWCAERQGKLKAWLHTLKHSLLILPMAIPCRMQRISFDIRS